MRYKPLTIPLGRGLDQATAKNAAADSAGLRVGKNLDFGLRGGLTGRPGAVRQDNFGQRGLDTNGDVTIDGVTTIADTTYTNPYLVMVRDGTSKERPGLVTRGRLYTRDNDDEWVDRLGICQAKSRRLCSLLEVGTPDLTVTASISVATNLAGCASYDFGPCQNAVAGTSAATMAVLNDEGSVRTRMPLEAAATCGNGARCGVMSGMVHVTAGTNNLRLVTYNSVGLAGADSLLASDAATPTGKGDAPCICCDYDQTVFFVIYKTTANKISVLRVSTAGVVLATYLSAAIIGGTRGIWVTNTSVATDRVVACWVQTGGTKVVSAVLVASTMALAGGGGFSLNQGTSSTYVNGGQVVCGVAESGACYICWVNDDGELWITKRSLTAATELVTRSWTFQTPPDIAGSGTQKEGAVVYLQHQPIKVGGRVLLGLSTIRYQGINAIGSGATWTIHDITNLWFPDDPGTNQTRDPVIVAKGEAYRSMAAFGPQAAILPSDGATSYRFPTVEWTSLKYVNTAEGATQFDVAGTLCGERGILGLNEITLDKFQATNFKDSTLIAGCVPRAFSRGDCYPVGFPWLEAPTLKVRNNAGTGAFAAGDYTFQAIWTWVDDAGQKHYSEPSFPITVTMALNDSLDIDIGMPHFNERETGQIYAELYSTSANGVIKSFRKRYPYEDPDTFNVTDALSSFLVENGEPLYTEGQVFEAQVPNASGGITSVGARCWVSDGHSLFASRLGPAEANHEAPSWFIDNNLTVDVPPAAGLVLGLASLNERVYAFCERGVYVTGGLGPDDTGKGQDFLELAKVSDLGVAHQRAIISTPKGIFFQSANTQADGRLSTGGLWLIDPSGACNIIGTRLQEELSTSVFDACYLPEREQVVLTGADDQLLLFDIRADQWCTWEAGEGSGDTLGNTVCSAAGVLWSCGTEPMKFTATTGQDTHDATVDVTQRLELGNLNIAGQGRWGRIKSMTILGDYTSRYELNQSITLDEMITADADPVFVNHQTVTTWPTSRHSPEWRIPQQKCSTAYITITAAPAVATWTAIELEVMTQGGKAPAYERQ